MCKTIITLLLMCLSVSICGAQNKNTESPFLILPTDVPMPEKAQKVGTVSTGISKNCNFWSTLSELKDGARSLGGNIVRLTKYEQPTLPMPCYRMYADVYNCDTSVMRIVTNNISSKMRAGMPDTADYALLYIYKAKSVTGSIGGSPIKINGKKMAHVKSNYGEVVKLQQVGETRIKTGRLKLDINTEYGQVYFIRFYEETKGYVSESTFTSVPPELGYWEYMQIKQERNSGKVRIPAKP